MLPIKTQHKAWGDSACSPQVLSEEAAEKLQLLIQLEVGYFNF